MSHLDGRSSATALPYTSLPLETPLAALPKPTTRAGIEFQVTLESPDPFSISGGYGDVFIGRDGCGNKVAAKRARCTATDLGEDKLRRLQREGATWQRLHHEFVLPFLGMSCIDGRLYLFSPFIKNGSLSTYIRSHPEADRVRFLRESADAIAYLHDQGIIHGDIKASNALVSDDTHVLVCDFGLARAVDAVTSSMLRGAGSVRWQAPELWRDQPKSTKTDVYAFGMLITEVLSGNVPFEDIKLVGGVILAVTEDKQRPPKQPSESPSGISYKSVWDVAERCWAHEAETRPTMLDVFRWMLQLSPIASQTAAPNSF